LPQRPGRQALLFLELLPWQAHPASEPIEFYSFGHGRTISSRASQGA
jgi:hypothetical protein